MKSQHYRYLDLPDKVKQFVSIRQLAVKMNIIKLHMANILCICALCQGLVKFVIPNIMPKF
jgi:hypothetical protein